MIIWHIHTRDSYASKMMARQMHMHDTHAKRSGIPVLWKSRLWAFQNKTIMLCVTRFLKYNCNVAREFPHEQVVCKKKMSFSKWAPVKVYKACSQEIWHGIALLKKAIFHKETTMLTTSKNVLCPGHNTPPANHWYWWPFTTWRSGDNQGSGHHYQWHHHSQTWKSDEAKWWKMTKFAPFGCFLRRDTHNFEKIRWGDRLVCLSTGYGYEWWLAGGYDLEIGHCQKWLTWRLPGG